MVAKVDNGGNVGKVFHRTGFNYDADLESDATGLKCLDPSRARQSEKDEADINTIVKNFGLTGRLPTNVRVPTYGDFDVVMDYQSALHAIRAAEASFMEMPADVRRRFDNDPGLFVDFCSDPVNLEEMRKLGLAVPAPVIPESGEPPKAAS